MQPKKIYSHIYKMLENATPIGADCGKLCGAACCEGDEDTGMYLFPFEECMYDGTEKWLEIYDSDFYFEEKPVKIAVCNGKCDRKKRPLSCRIFPLFVYSNGELTADGRAKHVCPLDAAKIGIEEYDREFTENVKKVFNILRKFNVTAAYLKETEKIISEQEQVADIFKTNE